MSNVLSDEKLKNLFGILEDTNEESTEQTLRTEKKEPAIEFNSEEDREDFVEKQLCGLLITANDILKSAKDIIQMSGDSESMVGASGLVNSVTGIISELNKSVLMRKRFSHQDKLEKMRIKARMELAEFKAKNDPKLSLGNGNTFNQMNLIPFKQEDIVKMIADAEKKQLNSSENDVFDVTLEDDQKD